MQVLWRRVPYTLCSLEHHDQRRIKRNVDDDCEKFRGFNSCSTSGIMGGAWLAPEKKAKNEMEVYIGNLRCEDGEALKVTTACLARTLEANALILVGDGVGFRVLPRP
jgi:hypothetical protein